MEDIDAVDSSKSKITLSKKKMIALPHWRANPLTEPAALHQINSQARVGTVRIFKLKITMVVALDEAIILV